MVCFSAPAATAKRNAAGKIINGVLLLQGNTGTGANWLRPSLADELFGPRQPLDATQYFMIMQDALGRGGSSKPSDGLKGKFPRYRYYDMVESGYRLITEDSPLVKQIRDNVIVAINPASDPDGRDRYTDWYYRNKIDDTDDLDSVPGAPYWGKYIFHDNNRDINYTGYSARNLLKFYLDWHPPVIHDLHESVPFLYIYSGQPPQNPNIDPITYSELNSYQVLEQIYEGFPVITPDGRAMPALAVSWEPLASGNGFRFKLREGVKFHSGRPFTAKDVKYTFEQLLKPGLIDRHLAGAQPLDLGGVDVDAPDIAAELGETGGRDEPDVAGADHSDRCSLGAHEAQKASATRRSRNAGKWRPGRHRVLRRVL